MHEFMARLRSLLSGEQSWENWLTLVSILDSLPVGQKELAAEYVNEHLDDSWDSQWRLGWGDWARDSAGWSLVAAQTRLLSTLPHAEELWLPPGTFQMGRSEGDTEARESETPITEMTLTQPFWALLFPITQRMWDTVFEENPSHFQGLDCPVENVTWYDAVAFCNALSEREGLYTAYEITEEEGEPGDPEYTCNVYWEGHESPGYRLPTEVEWEWMCRAGSRLPRYTSLEECAWYQPNSGEETRRVAQKAPNAWGLYDTLGNVAEWCYDSWGPMLPGDSWEDFVRDGEGQGRILRGASWFAAAEQCRASSRNRAYAGMRSSTFGFRVVRSDV